MATTHTPNLNLTEAVPGSNEPFSTSVVNGNWDAVDAWAGTTNASIATLNNWRSGTVDPVLGYLPRAGSVAARDTFYGVPANDTDALALQQKGARWWNTDYQWEEMYLGTYDATTNKNGATTKGWYPIAGKLPRARLYTNATGIGGISTNQYCFGGGYVIAPAKDSLWQVDYTQATGRLVPKILGRYRVVIHLSGYGNASTIARWGLTVNSTSNPTSIPAGDAGSLNGLRDTAYTIFPMGNGYSAPIDAQMETTTSATTDFIQVWFGAAVGFTGWAISAQLAAPADHVYYVELQYVAPPTPLY